MSVYVAAPSGALTDVLVHVVVLSLPSVTVDAAPDDASAASSSSSCAPVDGAR